MIEYVAGFAFCYHETRVVLVLKKVPAWQAGLYNGVGGKIEEGESPADAMRREAIEEMGLDTKWTHFARLSGDGFAVWFYRTEITVAQGLALYDINDVSEAIRHQEIHAVVFGGVATIPNLRWLVPMAHSSNSHDWPFDIYERVPEAPTGESE